MKTAKTGITLLSSALVMGAGLMGTVMADDATTSVSQKAGGNISDTAKGGSVNVGDAIASNRTATGITASLANSDGNQTMSSK